MKDLVSSEESLKRQMLEDALILDRLRQEIAVQLRAAQDAERTLDAVMTALSAVQAGRHTGVSVPALHVAPLSHPAGGVAPGLPSLPSVQPFKSPSLSPSSPLQAAPPLVAATLHLALPPLPAVPPPPQASKSGAATTPPLPPLPLVAPVPPSVSAVKAMSLPPLPVLPSLAPVPKLAPLPPLATPKLPPLPSIPQKAVAPNQTPPLAKFAPLPSLAGLPPLPPLKSTVSLPPLPKLSPLPPVPAAPQVLSSPQPSQLPVAKPNVPPGSLPTKLSSAQFSLDTPVVKAAEHDLASLPSVLEKPAMSRENASAVLRAHMHVVQAPAPVLKAAPRIAPPEPAPPLHEAQLEEDLVFMGVNELDDMLASIRQAKQQLHTLVQEHETLVHTDDAKRHSMSAISEKVSGLEDDLLQIHEKIFKVTTHARSLHAPRQQG